MPFLLGWLSLNLVLTSVVMAIIFHRDSMAHDDRGTAAEEHV
ncbi:exported protein of unknown function (plasmid) [Cupriavidus taiwanensis]|uniref:Uncharacterized protein n=1 Tax=Cupriavidus taiwanensis TaxID=164546 RepID=A0A375HC39_9BURK|nr:exported protein of unknown function [Cupriavidus taiwanensis]SOZ72464.1 exported protein of unknown function [Cupriavidus taiwanensis]SOZ74878.1 exported protein of unknown function [Cupriavidus taiwanensis]SPA11561.1 exported protein of unknown function [Cupriavidus taiwanensis]SPD49302.1 protein of unknown function [Cupriavidus taiwanensis]